MTRAIERTTNVSASTRPHRLELAVIGTGSRLSFVPQRLIIAGYTGSDQAAVRAHVDELARIGVPPPPKTPMFYEVPASLATTAPTMAVSGAQTSGEIEPVLIRVGGTIYLAVGSDHTDRLVEKRDIAESKASAPKPMGASAVPFDLVAAAWDSIVLHCRIDGELYQEGSLAAILHPSALLEMLAHDGQALGEGSVMFCGTLPLLGGEFVYGTAYDLELRLPGGASLTHAYQVRKSAK